MPLRIWRAGTGHLGAREPLELHAWIERQMLRVVLAISSAVTLVVPIFPGQYKPVAPVRILDTRDGTGGVVGKVGPNQVIAVRVAGQGPVPTMNSPTPPSAVVLNVTVTNPTADSYLTVYPNGQIRPNSSNLNFITGQTVPNLVIVPVTNGKIDFYNLQGTVDVIADLFGYYRS